MKLKFLSLQTISQAVAVVGLYLSFSNNYGPLGKLVACAFVALLWIIGNRLSEVEERLEALESKQRVLEPSPEAAGGEPGRMERVPLLAPE